MNDIRERYEKLVDKVIEDYNGRAFYWKSPVTSESDLILVGRSGLNLEFRDSRNKSCYVTLDVFLRDIEPTK